MNKAIDLRGTIIVLTACFALNGCQVGGSLQSFDREAAMAVAHQLHDELNRLEIAGKIEEQGRFYHKDVVRLDPNRAPQKGLDAFMTYAKQMKKIGYTAEYAKTTVLDAWVQGNRMVEYGTTSLRVKLGD